MTNPNPKRYRPAIRVFVSSTNRMWIAECRSP